MVPMVLDKLRGHPIFLKKLTTKPAVSNQAVLVAGHHISDVHLNALQPAKHLELSGRFYRDGWDKRFPSKLLCRKQIVDSFLRFYV